MTNAEIVAYNAGRQMVRSLTLEQAKAAVAQFESPEPVNGEEGDALERLGYGWWHRWTYRGALDALLQE